MKTSSDLLKGKKESTVKGSSRIQAEYENLEMFTHLYKFLSNDRSTTNKSEIESED